MVRARGLLTGTRRPPSTTDPRPTPWRTAARSGSCRPFGPHAAAISAVNIVCITAIPAATLIASSPSRAAPAISVNASRTSAGRSLTPSSASSAGASGFDTTRSVGTVFMAVPLSSWVSLAGHPRPTTRQDPGGGPPPKFHEDRDTLKPIEYLSYMWWRPKQEQSSQLIVKVDAALQAARTEYARRVYDRVMDWYKVAETKAQLVLTVNGVFITIGFGIVSAKPDGVSVPTRTVGPETWGFLALAVSALAGAI